MTYLNLPFHIPGYRIVRRLGLGGMATVYLATQESLGRSVALKVLISERAPSDELVRRFEHEARTIARLEHPHIVSIFDVGRTSTGQIFYTMPYLPNGDLGGRNLRDDPRRVLEIVRALAEALGSAHDQGIVHRDVKPENVLFDKLDRPLLADFGIALSNTHEPRMTREGATIGSSGYMSPEQARGQPLDGRADFYSLGVMCYELLTGELPFQGADSLAVALAHIEKPVPRLPVTRRVWQPLIDKALAKQPDARIQSADEFLAALALIDKRLAASPNNGAARGVRALVERFCSIPRRARAMAMGVALLAVLCGLLALLPRVPPPTAMGDPGPTPASAATTTVTAAAPAEAGDPAGTTPAPPPSAASVASDPTAAGIAAPTPESAEPAAPDRKQMLAEAALRLERGRLVTPAGGSAADVYDSILRDEPGQADAVRGMGRLFAALAGRVAKAIEGGDAKAAAEALAQGLALSERARLASGTGYKAFVIAVRHSVNEVRARKRDPFDRQSLAGLVPLLPGLKRLDPDLAGNLQADLDRPVRLLADGGTFRDGDGPSMAVVTVAAASRAQVDHAFAIAAQDVTRGSYARFADATGRAPARCRESQRLFARSDGLDWRAPGFTQGDDHPAVCVSWNDAEAYARWLSERTHARYRLPTEREWLLVAQAAGAGSGCGKSNLGKRSGKQPGCEDGYPATSPVGRFPATAPGVSDIAGNVSQWIDGCAKASKTVSTCSSRRFRGLSWRDDDDGSNLTRVDTSATDVGYAGVGFRLVRELPSSEPTTATTSP